MKVFKINDCEWYAAEDLKSAIQCAMEDSGLSRDDVTDDPFELTEVDMKRLRFVDPDFDPPIDRTFYDQLAIELTDGKPFPRLFACTEY